MHATLFESFMAEHLFDFYSFIERICFAGRCSTGVPKAAVVIGESEGILCPPATGPLHA